MPTSISIGETARASRNASPRPRWVTVRRLRVVSARCDLMMPLTGASGFQACFGRLGGRSSQYLKFIPSQTRGSCQAELPSPTLAAARRRAWSSCRARPSGPVHRQAAVTRPAGLRPRYRAGPRTRAAHSGTGMWCQLCQYAASDSHRAAG